MTLSLLTGTHASSLQSEDSLEIQADGLTRYSHDGLVDAYYLIASNQSEFASEAFEQAAVVFRTNSNWVGYGAAMNEVLRIRYESRHFDEAFEIAHQLLDELPNRLPSNHSLVGDLYFHYAELLYDNERYKDAVTNHLKALGIRRQRGEVTLAVASSFFALGNAYRFGDFVIEVAEDYYLKALSIWDELLPRDSPQLAECYYSLATTMRIKGDYDRGITFAREAVQIFERSPPQNPTRMANAYVALANNLSQKKDYRGAIINTDKALDLVRSTPGSASGNEAYYLNNLGVNYLNLNDPEGARNALNQAILICSRQPDRFFGLLAISYTNLAEVMKTLTKWDSAQYYHHRSVDMMETYYGLDHPQTIQGLIHLGQYFETRDQYDSALWIYHQSLIRALPEFQSDNVLDLPPAELINNSFEVSEALKSKADLLRKIYLEKAELAVLETSLQNYLLAQHSIALDRRSFEMEGSKLFLLESQRGIFENSLDCVYWLHQETGDARYLNLAFDFMEKSKSILLLESLNNAEAYDIAGVQDSLKVLEADLKASMGATIQQLEIEKGPSNRSNPRIKDLERQIFELSRQQDRLKKVLQENHPNYFEVKYNRDTLGMDQVRALLHEQDLAMVEYFWGDSAVFGLWMQGNQTRFIRLDDPEGLGEDLEDFSRRIAIIPPKHQVDPRDASQLAEKGHQLFQKLLEPFLKEEGRTQRLLIIGDGPLSALPFETLITSASMSNETGFNLPYLLLERATSYAFSANLYFRGHRLPNSSNSRDLLAFSYSDQTSDDLKTGDLKVLRGMGYNELPGAAKELKAIADLMEGEFFWGDDASETNFKLQASEYNILHLAVHGEGGQEGGTETKLVFKNHMDSLNDGALYPHELYNMPLGSRLVVLSACETAVGRYHTGEGMFSMARAFAYAGSPTLISTLWKINDNTTYRLISSLYQNLAAGDFIDEALRKAKISYLKRADGNQAHPANWAALVAFGDTRPLKQETQFSSWLWMLLIPVALWVGLWLFPRWKARSNSSVL